MTDRDDGGPAFPCDPDKFWSYKGEPDHEAMGLTLRDYFAGQALAGLLSNGLLGDGVKTAERAYQQADAMLAQRKED